MARGLQRSTMKGPRLNRLLADWSDLEKRGLLTSSPGREEAVRETNARTAAKRAAEEEARKPAKGK
jgi:hypothetical protein